MDQLYTFTTLGLIVSHNILGDMASNDWHAIQSMDP